MNTKLLKNVYLVDSNDLDKAIYDFYKQAYECVADQEWANDSHYLFNVTANAHSEYGKQQVEEFKKNGEGSYLVRYLLDDMCANGVIVPGQYLISVCW